jgi:transposase
MGQGPHRPYTRQFREQAVKLVTEQAQEPARVARELGMPQSTLVLWLHKAGWRKPVEEGPVVSDDVDVLKTQVRELRRQLKRSEMEKDILKKATAYFASLNTNGSPSSTDGEESSR